MGRLFDSKQFRNDLQLSGSFSGSFIGDGSSLTNVPATGIVGLNLSQIGSGSATASISPDNGLHVNTSISASIISGSILITAPTGSFKHIITDDDTIEFRNKSTGIQTGRLKFDSVNGLNVEDSAGSRTKIRAGRGEFLQLESFSSFNSIGPLTASIISASSTIFANDIEAFRMNVTHLTSSFITASTIETSGSNIFGDESSDTHTFVGDIIAQNNISSSGYISASNFIGDGSSLTGVDSIYTANGNILETRTINDRDGGFTGTAGSNALKMNVRNSGALLVAGYQNNGDPGTTNHLIQWGPGTTAGGMNVRGKLGLTSGGGRIDLTNSGGSQYFTLAQTGLSVTTTGGHEFIAPTIGLGTSGTTNYRVRIKGATSTSSGYGLLVQNSSNDNILSIRDDKVISISGSLDIKGINNNLIIGSGSGESITEAGAGVNNIILGNNAATGLTTGEQNVIIGDQAASAASFDNEGESVVIGYEAGGTSLGSGVDQFVAIGAKAGQKFGGYRDVVIGYEAGANNDGAAGLNVAIGFQAGKGNGYNSGNNVWVGANAGYVVNNADNNVGIGSSAGQSITNAQNNVLVGYRSGLSITTSDNNILLGYQAGYELTSATSSIVIGYDAADGITNMDRQLFIGSGSTALISGSLSGGLKLLGQVSASSYIGDGSGLTGIVTATNFTQSLFVSPSGDDATAAVGDMMKPFATILAATGSANPGDTIIVYPGIYTPVSQIIKDHVNYYFYPGAIVSGSIPLLSGTFEELNVRGDGIFDTNFNGDTINITANGVFECDTVRFGGLSSMGYAGAPKFAQDYTNYPNRNLTISGKFKYGKDGARTGNALGGAGVSIGGGAIIANVDVHVSSSSGMPGIRLASQYTDALINATVYANIGTALYSNQRISHTTIKGIYETGDQSTYYAIELSPGYVGNFFIDATMIGAIKLATGGVGQSGVDVRGFQSCTNSPSSLGAVQLSNAGYYTLHHRIEASENIFYQPNAYTYTTYTGNAQIMSNNSGKIFDIQGGRFIWKGSAGDTNTRSNQNTVSGGELIIDSPLIHYGSSYPSNRFCFNLTAGTLEINNKLIYHQNTTGSGIIDMSGGYLKLNGAQLIHADHTGSYAYAIDLNSEAHSGSIFNNSFTNLKPFGPGSFTNEIVGGGTLFESHKLY